MKGPTPPIEWAENHIRIIDQTLLPTELQIIEVRTAASAVAGAVTLGVTGALMSGVLTAHAVLNKKIKINTAFWCAKTHEKYAFTRPRLAYAALRCAMLFPNEEGDSDGACGGGCGG